MTRGVPATPLLAEARVCALITVNRGPQVQVQLAARCFLGPAATASLVRLLAAALALISSAGLGRVLGAWLG